MPIQFIPIITALSGLAGSAWDIYRKAKELQEKGKQSVATNALADTVAELETASLEQARLISDLSKDLEELARAIEAELEKTRRRCALVRNALFVIGAGACASLVLAIMGLLR